MNFENSEFFKPFLEGCKGLKTESLAVSTPFKPRRLSLERVGQFPLLVRRLALHHLTQSATHLPLGPLSPGQEQGEEKEKDHRIWAEVREHLGSIRIRKKEGHLWGLDLDTSGKLFPVLYPASGHFGNSLKIEGKFYLDFSIRGPDPGQATWGEFFLFAFQDSLVLPDFLFTFLLIPHRREIQGGSIGENYRLTSWELGKVLIYRLGFVYQQLYNVCQDIWTQNRGFTPPFSIIEPKMSKSLREELSQRFPGLLEASNQN